MFKKSKAPLVLALDGKWGTGKSHFLERWVGSQQADDKGYNPTLVYYDAFASDYLSDPLMSLLAAIEERIPEAKKVNWKKVAGKVALCLTKISLSVATVGATKLVEDLGEVALNAASGEIENIANNLFKAEKSKKVIFDNFSNLLKDIASQEKPLIIVVDELDRCRPDHSLSILEIIKHFFNVDHVHFVLGVNLESLENSVKARYGSGIDANNYLKKFINVRASLPDHVTEENKKKCIIKFYNEKTSKLDLHQSFISTCANILECTSENNSVSLRDVEKICLKMELAVGLGKNSNQPLGTFFIASTLIIASVIDEKFYAGLIKKTATREQILSFLSIPDNFGFTQSQINNKIYSKRVKTYFLIFHFLFGNAATESKGFNNLTNPAGITPPLLEIKNLIDHVERNYINIFTAY